MNKSIDKLKYQVVLEEFLAGREWEDELSIDFEEKKVSLDTGISSGEAGFKGHLIIEANDQTDLVDVFIYYDQPCKAAKLEQMSLLMNEIHCRWNFGRFMVFPDGNVRWCHRVDFEGSQPTGLSIERIVQPGWGVAEKFAGVIAAVALTKQTAADAIREYDEEQEAKEQKESPSEGGVPTEL